MRSPYQSPAIEQGLRQFANANMLPGTENLPEFLTTKRRACFIPYQSPAIEQGLRQFANAIEQGLRQFANANMLPGTENLPEFLTTKRRACFMFHVLSVVTEVEMVEE